MIILLSPSKTLDYDSPLKTTTYTKPAMLKQSEQLVGIMKGYNEAKLSKLMGLSEKLSALNVQRYKEFTTPFTPNNARQALLAFKGDVYAGIQLDNYKEKDFAFAQEHVRILSGLYGVLRPLDLMQAYRLEMVTKLPNKAGNTLYAFWGDTITSALNKALKEQRNRVIINCASNEYFKAVKPAQLDGELIDIAFKEKKGNDYKVIGIHAKKARGMMTDFMISNKIEAPQALKDFTLGGYQFSKKFSSDNEFVFTR